MRYFLPWVDRQTLGAYILSFDVLLIPASGAQIGNSPSKMFEYLASGVPIVAANTEVISEVLSHEHNSLLVDYKNPQAWADAINKVVFNRVLASRLIECARVDARKYTWDRRGADIVDFIRRSVPVSV